MSAFTKYQPGLMTDEEFKQIAFRDYHAYYKSAMARLVPSEDAGDSVEQLILDRARLVQWIKALRLDKSPGRPNRDSRVPSSQPSAGSRARG